MAKIVLVGDAWYNRDALFEHPFVGYPGVELAKMLRQVGLAPKIAIDRPSELEMIAFWRNLSLTHDIAVTNVFNTRVIDNDIELFFTTVKEGVAGLPPLKRGKYLKPELLPHLETLWSFVTDAQPNLVVALGNVACWALLGETKISALRGTVQMSARLNVKILPTYHPSAITHQWNLRPIVLTDLEKVAREAEYRDVQRIERWLTVEPTLDEIEEWLDRPADFYAVDIENPSAKVPGAAKPIYLHGQIAMIGFARAHNDAMVIPFFDERRPGGNFWSCAADEMRAWRLVDRALKSPVPKIFQNGVFDLTHLLRQGFRPRACMGDTMLLHHALYPEMLKGLGFLGSIYSDEIAWKTMSGKGNNLKRDE
jgi:uracil-DNA glycosylase